MITCKNQKGTTYYLKVGTTKTGKPRYYASSNKDKGANASAMPEGFGFRENVNGQVSVGKIQPCYIEPAELELIQTQIGQLECGCRAEVKGNMIVLHTAEKNQFASLRSRLSAKELEQMKAEYATYQPMLRFVLADKDARLFETERMYFSGRADWMWIAPPQPLKTIAEKYIPLLDDEEALFEVY